MKSLAFSIGMSFIILISACKPEPTPTVSTNFKITGFAQKGPFTIGSKVIASELNSNLIETGRTFNGTISDDKGTFSVEGSELVSNYVSLSADGFYFDEVNGVLSSSRLNLNALVDISKGNSLTVNVLTHLEFERVKYLVKSGVEFSKAKEQAQREILDIFKITDATPNFEKLDISKDGNEHAILLAISAIIQSSRSVASMSEILAKISLDIKEDGKLNAETIKADLLSHAILLNQAKVRTNLTKRLQDLGVNATIGNFEKHIEQFIKASISVVQNQISYPKTGVNGAANLLAFQDTTIGLGDKYCIFANLPNNSSLKVIVRTAPGQAILWVQSILGTLNGWSGGTPNGDGTRIFENTNVTPYAAMSILQDVDFKVEIYENGATTPNRIINIKATSMPFISFKESGKHGKNICPQLGSSYPYTKGAYSFQVNLNDNKEHTIKYEFYYFDKAAMLFSDIEGWIMTTDSSNSNNIKTALEFKGTKASADMKVTLAGSSNATARAWVDGVEIQGWYKKMAW